MDRLAVALEQEADEQQRREENPIVVPDFDARSSGIAADLTATGDGISAPSGLLLEEQVDLRKQKRKKAGALAAVVAVLIIIGTVLSNQRGEPNGGREPLVRKLLFPSRGILASLGRPVLTLAARSPAAGARARARAHPRRSSPPRPTSSATSSARSASRRSPASSSPSTMPTLMRQRLPGTSGTCTRTAASTPPTASAPGATGTRTAWRWTTTPQTACARPTMSTPTATRATCRACWAQSRSEQPTIPCRTPWRPKRICRANRS
eukprot:COSAG04_NODE_2824_length_3532_cov_1.608506_2_plen_265_part_00